MNDYDYEERKEGFPLRKLIFTILLIIVVVIIILLFFRFCGKTSLNDDLLQAGKDYYVENLDELPTEDGQCSVITADELVELGKLESAEFSSCDTNTLVKVCRLSNGSYQYTPILSCEGEKTEFDDWNKGTNNDLLPDVSDVTFMFKGYELNSGTKYFYPSDLTDSSLVDEYYKTSPNEEYIYSEDEQIGYKWYKNASKNVYYNSGEYVATQPSGFPLQGSSKNVTNVADTRPADASYRTITEVTMYRYTGLPTNQNACKHPTLNAILITNDICVLNEDGFTDFVGKVYTCDGINSEGITSSTVCTSLTEWSTTACPTNETQDIKCETKTAYSYTDKVYQWYTKETVKEYYPSGNEDVNKENTYFIDQPEAGTFKDESTEATVYKFYKFDETTEDPTFEEWVSVTPGFIEEDELYEVFNDLDYNVYSLEDINKNENIKYEIELYYRNVLE